MTVKEPGKPAMALSAAIEILQIHERARQGLVLLKNKAYLSLVRDPIYTDKLDRMKYISMANFATTPVLVVFNNLNKTMVSTILCLLIKLKY